MSTVTQPPAASLNRASASLLDALEAINIKMSAAPSDLWEDLNGVRRLIGRAINTLESIEAQHFGPATLEDGDGTD